jgi:hypothetical protein
MKQLRRFVVVVLLLLVAAMAFAGDKSFTIHSSMSINGTKLPAGQYRVHYSVNGSSAEVQFLQGKKTVTTATAELVDAGRVPRDSVISRNDSDGSTQLVALQFANQEKQLRFTSDSSGSH